MRYLSVAGRKSNRMEMDLAALYHEISENPSESNTQEDGSVGSLGDESFDFDENPSLGAQLLRLMYGCTYAMQSIGQ